MKKAFAVLLVDNLDDGLRSLQKSLERKYQTVRLAETKAEAVALYNLLPFDIVIVALEMYHEEGYEIINAIHAANPAQQILTYSAEPERPSSNVSCEQCKVNNLRHRIRKPIRLDELYEEIEHFDRHTCKEAKLKQRHTL